MSNNEEETRAIESIKRAAKVLYNEIDAATLVSLNPDAMAVAKGLLEDCVTRATKGITG